MPRPNGVFTYAHWAFYRVLFFLHLGYAYNHLRCRLGIYYQYRVGVCGWCGNRHVKPRRMYIHEAYAYGLKRRDDYYARYGPQANA